MSVPQPSRIIKILFLCCLFTSFAFNTLFGQALIGVVDYMKVDDSNAYIEIEKSWKKIHEERLKEGMIEGWSVFKVMFKTAEDSYNFVTVTWYDSFSKLDKDVPESIIEVVFPNKTKEEWSEFNDLTERSRKLISSGVFHQRLKTRPGEKLKVRGTYFVINEINVQKGKSKEYVDLMEDIYLPMYKEDISNENRASWSLWEKWPGNMKDFRYLAADAYASLDQIEPIDFIQYFKDIHPDKNIEEISKRIEEMRELVNNEMWKLIYVVD